jgi:hypothetical protein
MEINKYWKYRIEINVVENLEGSKSVSGYYDSFSLGNKNYEIIIDPDSKDKGLAKTLIENCLPDFEKILLNRPDLKKGLVISEETFVESIHSEN